MKKILIKSTLFLSPFILLFILNNFLYNQKEGDLARLGYLYSNPTPKSSINSQYELTKHYTLLSEINLEDTNKFDVITIGDSFSGQDSLGYPNFLGNKGLKVLHINNFISRSNPTQTLVKLLNSNLFKYLSADYIVLQAVERHFNQRHHEIDFDLTFNMSTLSNQINNFRKITPSNDLQFFSSTILKIPITNIQYNFQPKPKYSKIYKYTSNSNDLFSNAPSDLLFYQDDIKNMKIKNDSLEINKSIKVIERINDKAKKSKMKLIMLVSPDKYDLYFSFIKDNKYLTKPRFFKLYDKAKKNYLSVDSYTILSDKIKSERDIYFYDDSHWSPKGAKIIADEIFKIIHKYKLRTHNNVHKKLVKKR